jgi:hypothetical protein
MHKLMQTQFRCCGESGWEQRRKSSFGSEKLARNINIFARLATAYLSER